VPPARVRNSFQNEDPATGCDRRVRGKEARLGTEGRRKSARSWFEARTQGVFVSSQIRIRLRTKHRAARSCCFGGFLCFQPSFKAGSPRTGSTGATREPISLGMRARGGRAVDARGRTGHEGALVVRRAGWAATGAAGRTHRACSPGGIGPLDAESRRRARPGGGVLRFETSSKGRTDREDALVVRRAVWVATGAAGRPHRACRPSGIDPHCRRRCP